MRLTSRTRIQKLTNTLAAPMTRVWNTRYEYANPTMRASDRTATAMHAKTVDAHRTAKRSPTLHAATPAPSTRNSPIGVGVPRGAMAPRNIGSGNPNYGARTESSRKTMRNAPANPRVW